MNKSEKTEIISQIVNKLKESTAVFLIDYHGVNVEDINKLRSQFTEADITYKVYKNTLFNRALDEVGGYDELKNHLEGMTGYIFTGENYVAAAKIVKDYFSEKEKFSLKGCYIESDFFGADQLNTIASMPTKDEIMSGIVRAVAAPATGIVGAINAVMRDLVAVVDEIAKKKEAA
jgi:large subunit ribosomal protein L10